MEGNRRLRQNLRTRLTEKFREAFTSVAPIILIVLALALIYVPVSTGLLVTFLAGGCLLIAGMMLFTLGAELAISPMGSYVGMAMTKTRKIGVVVGLSFLLGFIITISEPDLQVLAGQISSIPNAVLILSVALGVGLFLTAACLRMLFRIPLLAMLLIFYGLAFVLAFFVPRSFLAVAFDAGGVTTGPMTVPFIMSMGVGVSAIRSDERAADDSFGLVSLCSIGPILTVMLLGMLYKTDSAEIALEALADPATSIDLRLLFQNALPSYLKEVGIAVLPLAAFMALFHLSWLHLSPRTLKRILSGLLYTYAGLVLFLTGAGIGFYPAGILLGQSLASGPVPLLTVPLAALMGFFIVKAEPAVYVLNRQVEEITAGDISASAMGNALSIGVAVSIALSMVRVIYRIPLLYFVIPGYAVSFLIAFFVPRLYTAIAFDSGGVASGPMTAAFLLPFAEGVCAAVGGDLVTDAFGVVSMVAMTPLITIQVMGLVARRKRAVRLTQEADMLRLYEELEDDAIIPL